MKTVLKLLLALAAGLLIGAASAQVTAISGIAVDQYGTPLPGAQVRVCSVTSTLNTQGQCTPTSTIYLDYGLTIPVGNPYQADEFGNYVVYAGPLAAPNLYMVQLFPASGITWSYVVNGPFCSIAGCTFTGGVTAPFFNATQSPYYEVNGSQLASTNLADTANIAYKNAANTFSAGPQTAPIWNATTQFNVNGVQIACTNLSDCANLAKIGSNNTFVGATNTFNAIAGTTITGTILNATTGYRFAGAAALNHVLLGNGTNYVDSASIPYSVIAPGGASGPFAAAGVPCATSTTASTVCTSAQIVTALNVSPSSTFAPALLPLATTAAIGGVQCDGTTITCTAGVIATVGTAPGNRVCNANGCYVLYSDGTLVEWGTNVGCGSGGLCSVAITFPTAFTTTTELSVTVGCNYATEGNCVSSYKTVTTSGFSQNFQPVVNVGGAGSNFDGSETGSWMAVGH